MQKISLAEKFSAFQEPWSPRIVGELNGQHVKLVKLQGDFVWHHHDQEDELFLVIQGTLHMDYREAAGPDQTLVVQTGEFVIVPRGMEHCPRAPEEVHVLLFEPAGTRNTGNVLSERTAGARPL